MSEQVRPAFDALETRIGHLSADKRALFERLVADGRALKPSTPFKRRAEREVAPLSFAQERLWFLEQLMPGTALFTLTSTWRLPEFVDVAVFERSLNEVARRHESLRTTFTMRNGEPLQVVAPELRLRIGFRDLCLIEPTARETEASRIAAQESQVCFDLERGPLLRVTLVRLANEDHLVVLAMHHIISDGWSLSVFWNDLSTIWRKYRDGDSSPLPAIVVQYGDVAAWEREWLQGWQLTKLLAYWRRQLADLTALEFPLDHPRPASPSGRGSAHYLSVPRSLTDKLRHLSRDAGATLFMTLLAAFQTLLFRYTGQDDVVVGTYTANRNRAEFEDVIGFFVNSLVLRADFRDTPTFRSLLGQVRRTALDAYAHQELPFPRLVQELSPDRDLSKNPLFQIAFQMLNAPDMGSATMEADEGEPDVPRESALLDLTCTVWENTSGLGVEFEYSTDLFSGQTIEQFSEHYGNLLAEIVANPDCPVSALRLLSVAERRKIVDEWNKTATDYPYEPGLTELFETQAAHHPDRIALIMADKSVTYRTLNLHVIRLARRLHDLGVGPEVRVGVCLHRSPDLVIAMLAVLRAGGVYVPLDLTRPVDRLAWVVDDAGVDILVSNSSVAATVLPGTVRRVDLDEQFNHVPDDGEPVTTAIGHDSTAYVIYTSGSTGRSKGIAVPHRQVLNRLHWMWDEYPFAPDEVACQKTSVSFVDSLWELLGALLHGFPTVIIPDDVVHDPEALTEVLQRHQVTRIWLVPSLLRELLLSVPDLQHRAPSLRFWVSTGETLSKDLLGLFENRLPNAVLYNLYGTSEVWDAIWCEPGHSQSSVFVPIGLPIANTQAYVLDPRLEPVPLGASGELYIGGVGLGRGYVGQPGLTAASFVANPFSAIPGARMYRTGDVARHQHDGMIELLGRRDAMVKLRGHRIHLDEIEAALMHQPPVRQAVVLLREDTAYDPRLVAYLVLNQVSSAAADITGQLRSALRCSLPEYMIPAAFVVMPSFPVTTSGKTDRRALPPPQAERSLQGTAYVPPRTAVEAQVADIWAELLGVQHVGVRDSFFELGGHSLLGIRMVSRVRAAFRVDIPLRAIFETPTVAALSQRIESVAGRHESGEAPEIIGRSRKDHAMRLLPNGELHALRHSGTSREAGAT